MTPSALPEVDLGRTVLDDGTRILTDRVPSAASVTLSVWIGVGGRDEDDGAGEYGASHFLEHLLFKGTERRTAADIAQAVDEVGGDMNAMTSSEYTCYHLRVPAEEVDVATELLLDVVGHPELSEAEFGSEREVILEELAAAEDDPEDVMAVRLFEELFPGHPLGREVLGTEESVLGMRRDRVAEFFTRWYRPCNVVVAAAGALDHDALVEAVAAGLELGDGGRVPSRPPPPARTGRDSVTLRPGEVAHLGLGWHAPGAQDPDRYASAVVNHVLGGGPASRLFQVVREERGLTYSIASGLTAYSDAGALTVGCATTPSKLDEVLGAISDEVERLRDVGVEPAELARAKRSLRGSLLLAMEDSGSRASRLGRGELVRGGPVPIDEQLRDLAAVDLDDVRRVAGRILASVPVVSVVGPVESGRLMGPDA